MATDSATSRADRPSGENHTSRLSLTLFGSFELAWNTQPLVVQPAGQRILAGLSLCGPRSRSALVALLFPDIREASALVRLRSALSRLRRQAPGSFSETGDRLALGSGVVVDTHSFEVLAHDLVDDRVTMSPADLDFALSQIDQDDLLIGWFDEWVLLERDRLAQLRLHALEALAYRSLAISRFASALEAATRAVRLDPIRETAHRAVMEVHLGQGNPGAVIRQYESYRDLLGSEFEGARPSPEMHRLLSTVAPDRSE